MKSPVVYQRKSKKIFERQIAIGDVHGDYELLKYLIEHSIKFNAKTDQLIFLGDLIDRGLNTKAVIEYVSYLKINYPDNIIILVGNHEEIAFDALKQMDDVYGTDIYLSWWNIGGRETLQSFKDVDEAKNMLLPFIENMNLYYKTDSHIFVHAGIPDRRSLIECTTNHLLWEGGMNYTGPETLVIGHRIHGKVTKYSKCICVDTGCPGTGRLSGYDVLNDEIFTSTRLPKGYY